MIYLKTKWKQHRNNLAHVIIGFINTFVCLLETLYVFLSIVPQVQQEADE